MRGASQLNDNDDDGRQRATCARAREPPTLRRRGVCHEGWLPRGSLHYYPSVPRTVGPARRGRSSDSTRCHSRNNACASRAPSAASHLASSQPRASTATRRRGEQRVGKKIRSKLRHRPQLSRKLDLFSFLRTIAKRFEYYGSSALEILFLLFRARFAPVTLSFRARVCVRKSRAPVFAG